LAPSEDPSALGGSQSWRTVEQRLLALTQHSCHHTQSSGSWTVIDFRFGQSLDSRRSRSLCWVSGNLDETEFENPEEVDFDRANKRHMAFGLGPHRCIGSDVVRLEFRIMFEQILSRMPDFRVEEAGLRPSPVPAVVSGYEHVPFVFMPGKKVGDPRIAY
jgi:hypothetical protein